MNIPSAQRLPALLAETGAILFDFDGILVDSEYYYFLACRHALQDFGLSIEEQEYYQRWTIRGIGMQGELAHQNADLKPEQIAELNRRRFDYYREYCDQGKISFIPGMLESMGIFIRNGLKTAIASNTMIDMIELIFLRAGRECPCPIIGRLPGLRPKPEADIFLYAAGTLQTPPTQCLIIEDALKGIKAAQKVSMKTMLIRSPYWTDGYDESEVDIVFNDSKEYLTAIDNLV